MTGSFEVSRKGMESCYVRWRWACLPRQAHLYLYLYILCTIQGTTPIITTIIPCKQRAPSSTHPSVGSRFPFRRQLQGVEWPVLCSPSVTELEGWGHEAKIRARPRRTQIRTRLEALSRAYHLERFPRPVTPHRRGEFRLCAVVGLLQFRYLRSKDRPTDAVTSVSAEQKR